MTTEGDAKRKMISQMVRGEDAMAPFMTNVDCTDFASFERYLAGQMRQALDLQMALERTGDEDGLMDWTRAKGAAFHEALLTFRRVMALEAGRTALREVPHE